MNSELMENMNKLSEELENLALQTWKGHEGLKVCLKLRSLKATAFKAGVEWGRSNISTLK